MAWDYPFDGRKLCTVLGFVGIAPLTMTDES
jgi:hypothetical protein